MSLDYSYFRLPSVFSSSFSLKLFPCPVFCPLFFFFCSGFWFYFWMPAPAEAWCRIIGFLFTPPFFWALGGPVFLFVVGMDALVAYGFKYST